jgi:hypothetical protein
MIHAAELKGFNPKKANEMLRNARLIRVTFDPQSLNPLFSQFIGSTTGFIGEAVEEIARLLNERERLLEDKRREEMRTCCFFFADEKCLECARLVYRKKQPGRTNDRSVAQFDHIKDQALGGLTEWLNVQILCTVCHLEKTQAAKQPSYNWADWDSRRRWHPTFLAKCEEEAAREAASKLCAMKEPMLF